MDHYITILTFTYPQDASIIKTRLEAQGIACLIKEKLTPQAANHNGNKAGVVELQIKESDRKVATEILEKGGYLNEQQSNAVFLAIIVVLILSAIGIFWAVVSFSF